MIDLKSIFDGMTEDVDSVIAWCEDIYKKNFEPYFRDEKEMFKRLQSKSSPITDEELEWILTTLPLQLFSVAEKLSNFKITQDVVRMKNKKMNTELIETSAQKTQTAKIAEAENLMLESKLVDTVFSAISSRVDTEISFSRELIMSAKKIWDRRRQLENLSPIGTTDVSSQLPDRGHKTFYEQQRDAAKNKTNIY